MVQKKYGVFGLMEYTINVPLGARVLQIPFTGGIASKDGVRPATYMTGNPVVQFAIENSKHFMSGRVKLLKVIESPLPTSPRGGGDGQTVGDDAVATDDTVSPDLPEGEVKKVAVACVDDARQYLMDNCGGKARDLRGRKAIEDFAKAHGVEFLIKE